MRRSKVERYQVTPEELAAALEEFSKGIEKRLAKHGRGVFIGKMEGLGACTEEWKELVDACQSGNIAEVKKEAMDVAVAAFWLALSTVDFPPGDRDESVECDEYCAARRGIGGLCRHDK